MSLRLSTHPWAKNAMGGMAPPKNGCAAPGTDPLFKQFGAPAHYPGGLVFLPLKLRGAEAQIAARSQALSSSAA